MTKSIVLMRFSSRDFGNSAAIAHYLSKYYRLTNIKSFTVDTALVRPCNNCDYECLQPEKTCPNLTDSYKELMDQICSADLVYFIVPNYCGYPCANYFAFNERSVGYFNMDSALLQKYMEVPKRFIVISNSEEQNFIGAMQQQVTAEPDILYLKSSKYGKKSIAGDILDSDAAKADLKAFLESSVF